jgi:hypothetical protein
VRWGGGLYPFEKGIKKDMNELRFQDYSLAQYKEPLIAREGLTDVMRGCGSLRRKKKA